ncbi:MAG: hypothetical protein P1U36_06935 [Legionellaceae bacterium]|nr:hypothetical protein [Legionellaceae bacterium]
MSHLPKDYKELLNFTTKLNLHQLPSDQLPSDEIEKYTDAIRERFLDASMEIPPAYSSMLRGMNSSENSDSIYMAELLARLDRHLDPEVFEEDKTANGIQLELLLNQSDLMNILLYGTGIAVLASIAIIATAGAVSLAMTNLPVAILTLLPCVLIAFADRTSNEEIGLGLIGAAVATAAYALCVQPGLFLTMGAAYAATYATLFVAAFGIEHCTAELSLSANNYKLRSNARALINTGIFSINDSDETGIELNDAHVPSA